MKGVILSIAPDARLVDISHDVRSYDILEAVFLVETTYRYFPAGTVHIVVVDPGVGSARRPIAVAASGHRFVGPDNGVLSAVLQNDAYHITNIDLFRKPVSRTFHGRDIFSPVAAHLAQGMPIESVGPRIFDFVKTAIPAPQRQDRRLVGRVMHVDKFGNIITNLRRADLSGRFTLHIAGEAIQKLHATFSDAKPGEFFVVEGSTGYIEVALNQGSAAEALKTGSGVEIEVESDLPNH